MKKINLLTLLLGVLLVSNSTVFAQSKIKDGTVSNSGNLPDPNALVEFESNNKGILLPKVALTSTTSFLPLTAHVTGMMVYNTATAGTAPNNVTPGFYYNTGNGWVRFVAQNVSKIDSTNDGWKDDASGSQVKLAYQSNGSTARATGTEFVIKDDGKVGIGTTAPSATLEVNGTVEINTVNNVPANTTYQPLVWNTTTQRVEVTADNSSVRRYVTVASGATATIDTLTASLSYAGYEIKILVGNDCIAGAYNKFMSVGATSSGSGLYWRINFIAGVSENGPATGTSSGNGSTVTVSNPLSGNCGTGGIYGNATSFNYTLTIEYNSGKLSITNNGNVSRNYIVIIEKVIE